MRSLLSLSVASAIGCAPSSKQPAPIASISSVSSIASVQTAANAPSSSVVNLPTDPRCAQDCSRRGLCGFNGTSCVARSDEDCHASQGCMLPGRCVARDGWCFFPASSSGDCTRRRTFQGTDLGSYCENLGECEVVSGACRATSAAQCRNAKLCATPGTCELGNGRCLNTDQGCAQSEGCKKSGDCAARDGVCVPTDAGCRASESCRISGSCHAAGDECAPTSEAECKASLGCKLLKECLLREGRCTKPPDPCASTPGCKSDGLCVTKEKKCVASQSGCEQSNACAHGGKCDERDGVCY